MSQTITSEPNEDRLSKFENQILAHPILGSVYKDVIGLLQRPAVPIIEVVGPTGVGKSTLLKKVFTELLKNHGEAMARNSGLIPVVVVEVPAPDSGSFHWGDFYKRFLEGLSEPMVGYRSVKTCDGASPICTRKGGTVPELRWAVEQGIKHRGTKVVIIDEAQHLTKVSNARRLQDQMDTIKSLSSLAGVQFVMVGTYELLSLLNRNGQLARRTRCIHFHRYNFQTPADRQAFANLLHMFELRLPVKAEGILVDNLEFIYERCLGCIGILKDWLKLACNHALYAGHDSLEMHDLGVSALTEDSLLQILQEILEGERSIEAARRRTDELRAKLGIKEVKNSAAPINYAKEATIRRSVGERNPTRDVVGV